MTHDQANPANSVSRALLPAAMQRWLEKALPQNLDLPSSVRIDQEGAMDIRGRWTPFTARGVYTANPLSFNWQARLRMLPGVRIMAEDGHLDGRGRGGAKLWGVIYMGQRTDPEVLIAQVVRNLGELALLPSLALADPSLTWTETGDNSFEVRRQAGNKQVAVRFEIDDHGDVIRAYSPSRPYDVPGGYAESPWYYTFTDHREFGGVWIPAVGVATFEKSTGAWEYFRGRITAVTFGTTPP